MATRLRGDDGVGPRVAEAVGHLRLPGVRTLICPLLSPELAEPISRARQSHFCGRRRGCGE